MRNIYTKYGIKIENIWFENEKLSYDIKSKIRSGNSDIVFFHAATQLPDKTKGKLLYSIVSDLTKTEDELFKKITKNCRYEIKRSIKEEGEIRSFFGEEFLAEKVLFNKFQATYNEMYCAKNIKCTFNKRLIQNYLNSHNMAVTIAFYQKEPYVFHSYVYSKSNARLLYSTSPFRTDREMATMIGRMNKALHWADMKLFKDMGVNTYDWGGISSIEEPNGIDKFKMAFGGEITSYYDILMGITLKGKLVCFLRDKIL